ncbi:uncharacterized protein LOC131853654 [Achroia grisella]|uniref:uncharacterized protein LOC131853654 n=1 Tax=Achroia grisella TaxID=688607 RepID=UPI0027D34F2B|nr:uncharacterized protein LOC131853654 [Achroia grisella]
MKRILLLSVYVVVYLIVNTVALPKDSSVLKTEDVQSHYDSPNKIDRLGSEEVLETEPRLPNRVPCDFEEATEDTICQEHCLPKGYSYGLCISKTCSCV